MCWLLSLRSEIAGRHYQRSAEMPVPDAIHYYTSSEGRSIRENLLRQVQTTGSALEDAVAHRQHRQEMARSDLTGRRYVTAPQNRQVARFPRPTVYPGILRIGSVHV